MSSISSTSTVTTPTMPSAPQDVAFFLRGLDFATLLKIREQAEQLLCEKVVPIIKDYGSWFSKIVGAEQIARLPEVEASQLHLESESSKYYEPDEVREGCSIADMKGQSAVRGMTGRFCPFIAIALEATIGDTTEKVVEVVFKRYGILFKNPDGSLVKGGGATPAFENNYVTTLTIRLENGKSRESFLYSTGGMNQNETEAVRDLLQGKEIIAPCDPKAKIRMIREQ